MLRRWLYQCLFWFLGVRRLYREIVIDDRTTDLRAGMRRDLVALLEDVNRRSPYFRGRFSAFLRETARVSDDAFYTAFAKLPVLSKQDYAEAGASVMAEGLVQGDPAQRELRFHGRPWQSIRRLRRGDFLMPMATGGSSALPLVVWMTKHHMFSMLFTFFKCWYRMGWRPGDRMLVFYPRNTYNIDEMVTFNRFSWLTGFRYHLFDHIDESTVRGLVDELNRFRPRLLLVFPSPMNMVAHTIRRFDLPLRHHPEWINVSGETFFDCQRHNIESVFRRSRIDDSYGSVELGEIAHEAPDGGLEVFANVAYVETIPNDAGQPEMVVTRLHLSDFPFIRYKMKDIATIASRRDRDGWDRNILSKIEGKDSNFILSDRGERFYPSFFNSLVNDVNRESGDAIIEIKVYERGQRELEVQLIVTASGNAEPVRNAVLRLLRERLSPTMEFRVRFVDFIDHDYRRKYRVIERIGDVEFAGGMVGDARKQSAIRDVQLAAESAASTDGSSRRR